MMRPRHIQTHPDAFSHLYFGHVYSISTFLCPIPPPLPIPGQKPKASPSYTLYIFFGFSIQSMLYYVCDNPPPLLVSFTFFFQPWSLMQAMFGIKYCIHYLIPTISGLENMIRAPKAPIKCHISVLLFYIYFGILLSK